MRVSDCANLVRSAYRRRSWLPPWWNHTCDLSDLSDNRGKRVVIIGGRQSAYEYSALLLEAGATRVDVVHRHPTPAFTAADWSWTTALTDRLERDPGHWQRMSEPERQVVTDRLFGEGRLKLEPWLTSRLRSAEFHAYPERTVTAVDKRPDGELRIELDDGRQLAADRVLLATGYRTDAGTVALLRTLLPRLARSGEGLKLDDGMQTSIPGLFATGALAGASFGPLFGFTVVARPAAAVLAAGVSRYLAAIRTP